MAALSREQVARLLYQAGFRGDAIWKLIAIAGRESSYDPRAHRTDQDPSKMTGDRGLFQINYTHDQQLKDAGIIRNATDLFNPLVSARAAYFLSHGGDEQALGQLWGAGPGGWNGQGNYLFGTDPTAAQAAFNNARQSNWPPRGGTPTPAGPPTQAEIAQGLGNLGVPGYAQYATDPRRQVNSRYQALVAAMGGGPGGGLTPPPDPTFYNWQDAGNPPPEGSIGVSPHLQEFEKWVFKNFGGTSAGDYDYRDVVGPSNAWSSHAFGSAFDWKFGGDRKSANQMIKLVTENPGAFGIQAIHDYQNSRIWRIGREGDLGGGWQAQPKGSGGGQMGDPNSNWLHFEVNKDQWDQHGGALWHSMNAAKKGLYSQEGQTFTPQQFAARARRMGNRGNPLFEDYATIGPRLLEQRQANFATRPAGVPLAPSETAAGIASSQDVTNLLKTLGVDYPDAPMATPALMAYLRGVGLSMDTAKDIRRRTIDRAKINKQAALEDITRQAVRSKEGVTGDLISRGMLSSGEANTRYARQAEDVAASQADVQNQTAGAIEAARTAYQQQLDAIHTGILEQTASAEETQNVTEATNQATARGYNRANRLAQQQSDDLAAARQQQLNALLGQYRRQNRWLRRHYLQTPNPQPLPPRLRTPTPAPGPDRSGGRR